MSARRPSAPPLRGLPDPDVRNTPPSAIGGTQLRTLSGHVVQRYLPWFVRFAAIALVLVVDAILGGHMTERYGPHRTTPAERAAAGAILLVFAWTWWRNRQLGRRDEAGLHVQDDVLVVRARRGRLRIARGAARFRTRRLGPLRLLELGDAAGHRTTVPGFLAFGRGPARTLARRGRGIRRGVTFWSNGPGRWEPDDPASIDRLIDDLDPPARAAA